MVWDPADVAVPAREPADVAPTRHRWSEMASDRVLTLPNLLSLARLAGAPLLLWLLLGPHADRAGVLVLIASGLTDWLDGKTARLLNQHSHLGALLDPAVDRLYILATLAAFLIRGIVPWWAVAALVGRDLVLAVCIGVLRRRGYRSFPVTYLGKAATLNLLYAFPLLLLAQGTSGIGPDLLGVVRALACAFAVWGGALYLWSGVVYLAQFRRALRSSGEL